MAREAALQALYQCNLGGPKDCVQDVLDRYAFTPETSAFAKQLADGCVQNEESLIRSIVPHLSAEWPLARLAWTDRCILVVAAYELLHLPEMPPKVTINEAVALAKRFGSADSGKFVNGVLGSLLKVTEKRDWQGGQEMPQDEGEEDLTPEPELEVVEEGTAEHEEFVKAIPWTIKTRSEAPSKR
ncbi:MAG: hypothetical protein HONBIEJF_01619 [Fimbriimonadaceae bacterium]|nr:hypothetical protein [Fimbriimonadaceae bacterium]